MDTVLSTPTHDLYAQLGGPHAPCILDVRRDAAYERDDRLIAAALRPAGNVVEYAAHHARGRPVVAYCVRGHEVSQEAAAALAAGGFSASYLEGGIERWREDGLPTIRRRSEWHVPGGSRWITRARPKIDRIACPWLIRRFIDPLAELAYVPAPEVLAQARARDAVAFDIQGAPVHHRGERCSFDALLEDFDLHDEALDRLAAIVRGADTDRLDLAPESRELLAASMELSRRYEDDHEMLEKAMPLYDALYAKCRR